MILSQKIIFMQVKSNVQIVIKILTASNVRDVLSGKIQGMIAYFKPIPFDNLSKALCVSLRV
jgi:hypothetical protein